MLFFWLCVCRADGGWEGVCRTPDWMTVSPLDHRDRLEQLERQRERDRKIREQQQKEQRDLKERERRADERRKERDTRREGQSRPARQAPPPPSETTAPCSRAGGGGTDLDELIMCTLLTNYPGLFGYCVSER